MAGDLGSGVTMERIVATRRNVTKCGGSSELSTSIRPPETSCRAGPRSRSLHGRPLPAARCRTGVRSTRVVAMASTKHADSEDRPERSRDTPSSAMKRSTSMPPSLRDGAGPVKAHGHDVARRTLVEQARHRARRDFLPRSRVERRSFAAALTRSASVRSSPFGRRTRAGMRV